MSKKRGPKISELDIVKVSYWRVGHPKLSDQEIADKLGWKLGALQRRIKEARDRGWIDQDWIFKIDPSRFDEVLAEVVDHPLQNDVREKYGTVALPKLSVVPTWPPKGAPDSKAEKEIEETNRRIVAHRAALILLKRLPYMKEIGLSYGRTLRMMIDKLEYYSSAKKVPPIANTRSENSNSKDSSTEPPEANMNRTIYTIMGALSFPFDDKRHGAYLEYSASHLTNRMAKILGTNCKRYFLDTPVYVPRAFLDAYSGKRRSEALKMAAKFVKQIPTYYDLFEKGEDSAIEKLDTVISSVGDFETGFGSLPNKIFLSDDEIKPLKDEAVGDIAGRYVTKEGETGKKGSTIAKVNSRIFGLELKHLESIAKRAEERNTPGVIVIAASRAKAKVIHALLNRSKKVISELIISGDLAEELVKLSGS